MQVILMPKPTQEMKPLDKCFHPERGFRNICCEMRLYSFRSPAFEIDVYANVRMEKGKSGKIIIPTPVELYSALDRFAKTGDENAFVYMSNVDFCPFGVYMSYDVRRGVQMLSLHSAWLACVHAFRKSYDNFASNFNPNNYQII